jgi:site-specific recombinase XerD
MFWNMCVTLNDNWWRAFQRLDGAYAPATLRAYRADVEAYEKWCASERIEVIFPVSVDLLCRFIEDEATTKSPSTIKRRLCAFRLVSQVLGHPDPTGHPDVLLAMRRVVRRKAMRPRQAKGLTKSYLDQFQAVQPDSPWGLRNRAMLSLGYELLTRRSELVALRTEDLNLRCDGTYEVLIRRSKSDQVGAGRIAFTSIATAQLVQDWLSWRGNQITTLFCPIYQGHPVDRSLEPGFVKSLVKEAAKAAGLSSSDIARFSGHSMRVGAAQDLLQRGVDTAAIMRAGGWKSVNVLARYLEKAEHNVWS